MSTKIITIQSCNDADELIRLATHSAARALERIRAASDSMEALELLWHMKATKIGCNPLDADAPLNLIEQLNQTFTYIASALAAKILLERHPSAAPLQVNLGTSPGADIYSDGDGGIAAEVFAATSTRSNDKLRKDIARVARTRALHKYVFFMCPGEPQGKVAHGREPSGVQVWSLGAPAGVQASR
jgi:hypothetical protein